MKKKLLTLFLAVCAAMCLCFGLSACGETETVTVAVENITLNKTELSLSVGADETLSVTYAPSTATDKTVTWSSSNTSVATVSNAGKVTAVGAGTATVTAKTSNNKSATCTVTVTEPVSNTVAGKTFVFSDFTDSNGESDLTTDATNAVNSGSTIEFRNDGTGVTTIPNYYDGIMIQSFTYVQEDSQITLTLTSLTVDGEPQNTSGAAPLVFTYDASAGKLVTQTATEAKTYTATYILQTETAS